MNPETDHPEISIFFHDKHIGLLFSELLRGMGYSTTLVRNISEVNAETKIITEPIYYPEIGQTQKGRCLLIGSAESLKGLDTLSISQPLTESKINSALKEFLSPSQDLH